MLRLGFSRGMLLLVLRKLIYNRLIYKDIPADVSTRYFFLATGFALPGGRSPVLHKPLKFLRKKAASTAYILG